jgi:hypothetical protein
MMPRLEKFKSVRLSAVERAHSRIAHEAGEVRRYMRFLVLADSPHKRGALLRIIKHHAKAAWHLATQIESAHK